MSDHVSLSKACTLTPLTPVSPQVAGRQTGGSAPLPPPYLTPQGRDLRLDMLRGFCVLAMIVNHISGASPLHLLTGGDRFFTSAAAGFILVSGFTAGMVYRRLVARDGLVAAMTKGWRRAFSLYLLTVGLTLFLVPIAEYFQLPFAISLDLSRAVKFVVSVLTLHRTYTLVNVLLLYTLLFVVMPVALLALVRGRTRALLIASWLLWLVYQVYPEPATFPWQVDGGYLFAFSAWQVLFFTTLALGYHRDRIPNLSPQTLRRLHLLTGLAGAAFIAYFALFNLPVTLLPGPLRDVRAAGEALYASSWQLLFVKARVGPGRMLASMAVYGFMLLSLTRWWQPVYRLLGGLLLPLGRHALYAWTVHILLIVVIGLGLKALGLTEANPWLNTPLQIAAVALIWWMTRRQICAVTPRTRPYWQASPIVLALLTLLFLQLPRFDAVPPPSAAAPVSATPQAETSLSAESPANK